MDEKALRNLLQEIKGGKLSVDQGLEQLRHLPFEDLGFAKIDHHRSLRQGFAEVVFGWGKTADQIEAIVQRMLPQKHNLPGDSQPGGGLRANPVPVSQGPLPSGVRGPL